MKEIKNIIIQNLDKHSRGLLKEVMSLTGQKTASKAIFQSLSEFILYRKRYYDLEKRYINLVGKIDKTPKDNFSLNSTITEKTTKIDDETYLAIKSINQELITTKEVAVKLGRSERQTRDRIMSLRNKKLITMIKQGKETFYKLT